VAFCTANVVPGIDFSNDPLLQGRNHSYLDTQLSRLGGPNLHEIAITSPVAPVHNNQRDGLHRQAVPRGRVAYEPNSLGGGCPFQAGMRGYTSFPQPVEGDKVRGRPEKFAEHYAQARQFWMSQSAFEQTHIANAFRFELTRVQVPAVRRRVLALLGNVDAVLADTLAAGLGMETPPPLPLASPAPMPDYAPSPALSLTHRPGAASVLTRRVAILVGPGSDGDAARDAHALDFVRLQYRHGKPMLAVGAGATLLAQADVPPTLPDGSDDPFLIRAQPAGLDAALVAFKAALAAHRLYARETDPPLL